MSCLPSSLEDKLPKVSVFFLAPPPPQLCFQLYFHLGCIVSNPVARVTSVKDMSSTQKGVIAFSPLLNPKSQFRLTKFKLPFQTKDVLQLPKEMPIWAYLHVPSALTLLPRTFSMEHCITVLVQPHRMWQTGWLQQQMLLLQMCKPEVEDHGDGEVGFS